MAKPLYSITPFTMLDYPDKAACIFWFAGCNMRCSYCYNPDIVDGKGKLGYDDALQFLDRRLNLLDGVVLSGGECTLHKGLPAFIAEIKRRGLKVKIDTNGSKPQLLEKFVSENLIDFVALDFKAPARHFKKITASDLYKNFTQSLEVLINSTCKFEVRTTVHSNLLTPDDLREMAGYLETVGYNGPYFIQNFVNDTPTLGNLSHSRRILTPEDFNMSAIQVIFRA